MPPTVLGLDIGGANLKAATADRRAAAVPFALWKQPDGLAAALAGLVKQFPDAEEFAVTMTGELCDCYETKRQGVNAILTAVQNVSRSWPIRVWSTDGKFVAVDEARRDYLKVAAANWHALATFAGRYAPRHGGLLIDIGSTTSDIIPLTHGVPYTYGQTDWERLRHYELIYTGVRRTPVCAVANEQVAAELFADMRDVNIVLGLMPEAPGDSDTADGRPATFEMALARMARMFGGDLETLSRDELSRLTVRVHEKQVDALSRGIRHAYFGQQNPPELRTLIVAGAGEFLAREAFLRALPESPVERIVSLNEELGPAVSACGPAYALAVLAAEPRP